MKNNKSRTVTSKWTKTKWMLHDSSLRKFVPATKLFSKNSLMSMTNSYSTLYYKPTNGTGGKKIVRIKKLNSRGFSTKHSSTTKKYGSIDKLYRGLSKFANGKSYILQQGIQLAKTNGKPFDLRVMVQKTRKKGWVTSAICAKVGQPGKVVTNYHQGGKLTTLRKTLKAAGYKSDKITQTTKKLKKLGSKVSHCFDQHKKGFRELGLDVAIDHTGDFWILEVNTRPCFYPLKNLSKSMYRRVLSNAKEYGRS